MVLYIKNQPYHQPYQYFSFQSQWMFEYSTSERMQITGDRFYLENNIFDMWTEFICDQFLE